MFRPNLLENFYIKCKRLESKRCFLINYFTWSKQCWFYLCIYKHVCMKEHHNVVAEKRLWVLTRFSPQPKLFRYTRDPVRVVVKRRGHRNHHGWRLLYHVLQDEKFPRKYCSESYKTKIVTLAICTINALNFEKYLDSFSMIRSQKAQWNFLVPSPNLLQVVFKNEKKILKRSPSRRGCFIKNIKIVSLRPIYTGRLCRICQAYYRPTTWIVSCKSKLQLTLMVLSHVVGLS